MLRAKGMMVLPLVVMLMAVVMSVGGSGSGSGIWAASVAQDQNHLHHVVGGDRGWDLASDVASWAAGRAFRVGDKIWFAYSAAQESIAELKSKEEYESCDVSNPIRMFTDGLDGVPLDGEGIRYFVSSKTDSCKNGLKLHVEVMPEQSPGNPRVSTSEVSAVKLAAEPTSPSGSAHYRASFVLLFFGIGLLCMGF